MPFEIEYPLVNGHEMSFASIELIIGPANRKISKVKAINYKDSLTPGVQRGTGPHKLGRTRGTYDAEGSIEMSRLEFENLKEDLGNDGYGEVSFGVQVQYSEANGPVITDTLSGCRIKSPDSGNSEGTEPSMIKLDLDVMHIKWNGVTLVQARPLPAL